IRIGTQVNFDLRLINNESFAFSGIQNGFRFYSPDGATWNSTTADTIGEFGQDLFNLIVAMVYFSPDGINEDTVGFGAALINSPGLYPGYDGPSMRLTVGPIDALQVGKTLCFDSTFFPPAAVWLWHSQVHGDETPQWGGPYCFNIVNAPDYPEEPPPPPSSGDSLIVPSITVVPGTGVQTVSVQLSQPIKGATIPLRIPDGVVVSEIERDSLITADWDYVYPQIKQDSGFVFVALANSFGATIPTGTTDLFRIHFSASNFSCEQDRTIRWDTTLMGQVSRQLTFSDATVHPVYPGFSYLRDSVSVLPFTPGDCSADNTLDISDLICLAEYMFTGGAEPVNLNAVDNNGDCLGPDISDLIYLVDYQFLDGPTPMCGCVLSGKRNMPQAEDKVVTVTYERDATIITLTSPVAVRGVEFTLKGAGDVIPVKLVGDKLDMLSGNTDGGIHVGILDMDGPNTIPSGNTRLVRLIGTYEIASAIVAVDGSHSEAALLSGNAPMLPDKFELYQNYPNPFNPSTEIGFALPQTANVRLEIFNIMGQRVKLLADRQMEAGVHTILWDGRDAAGNTVASGVYFYRLDAGQYTASRKMLLLK
ncbi:MAG TPA: FlgD immunoglobulin-like domain containing protein, partial [candidate division Zixibacteria bacterium]|nr:FlgD immunoglobulin-like domain containing protein [candidate division Zixibacteria bacterium]